MPSEHYLTWVYAIVGLEACEDIECIPTCNWGALSQTAPRKQGGPGVTSGTWHTPEIIVRCTVKIRTLCALNGNCPVPFSFNIISKYILVNDSKLADIMKLSKRVLFWWRSTLNYCEKLQWNNVNKTRELPVSVRELLTATVLYHTASK